MVEESSVRFRWFRTVETTCQTITLHSLKKEGWPSSIKLEWDKQKMLYESFSSVVPCGKHTANLCIDGIYHRCKAFTIVPDTFEVHLFLLKENIEDSIMNVSDTKRDAYLQSKISPLQVKVDWSPNSNSLLENLNRSLHESQTDLQRVSSKSGSVKWDLYEEILASKNQEIRNLKNELKRLRLSVVDIYSSNLETPNSPKSSDGEFGKANKDNKLLDSSLEEIRNGWNVEQVNEKSHLNESHDEKNMFEGVETNKNELNIVLQRNRELSKELMKLRADNKRLRKLLTDKKRVKSTKPIIDSLFSSEQDSESTQYRQLPTPITNIYSSKSLPEIGLQHSSPAVPRRFESLDNVTSRSTDFLLNEVSIKMGSSVQTDLTAVEDPPRRWRIPKMYSRSSDQSIDPSPVEDSALRRESSSDTEELLQEAENFIIKTLGNFDADVISRHNEELVFQSTMPESLGISNKTKKKGLSQPLVSSGGVGKRKKLRPFLPKSIKDLTAGHIVRYFTADGKLQQGKIAYLSSVPGESSLMIAVEELNSDKTCSSSSPRKAFLPFKKVILAWEEWILSEDK